MLEQDTTPRFTFDPFSPGNGVPQDGIQELDPNVLQRT